MKQGVQFQSILAVRGRKGSDHVAVFALMSLGLIESLTNGLLSASDAVRAFFHADNCLFVRKKLRDHVADEIMSRGAQLPDLFDVLPVVEAQREFQHELTMMRALCFELLEKRRSVA